MSAIARATRAGAAAERAGDALAWAEDALAAAARDGAEIAAVTVPAAGGDPLRARGLGLAEARAAGSAAAIAWAPAAGPVCAGAGEAALLRVDAGAPGPDRFAAVRAAAESLFSGLDWRCHPAAQAQGAPPPRLFGGFSFARGGGVGLWQSFGEASFWLPRWCRGAGAADGGWITVALRRPQAADARAALLAELERLLVAPYPPAAGGLEDGALEAGGRAAADAAAATVEELGRGPWRELCAEIASAISAGDCAKVVAARRTLVRCAAPIAPGAVLSRLRARFRDCFAFALARGDAALVGATPERLVARSGARVRSDALAGSIAPGDRSPARLLASAKERGEQELVVRAIAESLRPLCDELSVPREPAVRRLRNVLHLHTPIEGRLAAPVHVLDLVAALHPTPAVGGVPTAHALAWIAAREPAPRGWYGAPVGWFDAAGDGEFAVAIRTGLLVGRDAYLYAGAGVVAGSDADAEYAETGLKQQALLEALGVTP